MERPSRVAITSMSLGRAAQHALPAKLLAASRAGIEGIEMFYEDLQCHAKTFPGGLTHSNEILAARQIRSLCAALSLKIISLQPCWADEGLIDRQAWTAKLADFRHRIAIAHALGIDLLLIPTSINVPAAQLNPDPEVMAADLREIADLGAAAGVRFAHESLCWGTTASTWEQSWDLVKRVDRPNFGICIDTFNIAGRCWADPAMAGGKAQDADAILEESLARLAKEVDPKKVFLLQVVSAEKLSQPLVEGHEFYAEGQPARMSWSRNCRLFYGERDAYLPVKKVTDVVFGALKYRGWVSMELFNRSMSVEGENVPTEHAERAYESWRALATDSNLKGAVFVKDRELNTKKQQLLQVPQTTVQESFSSLRRVSDVMVPPAVTKNMLAWERFVWLWATVSTCVGIFGAVRVAVAIYEGDVMDAAFAY